MEWELTSDRPIYLQLMEQMKIYIFTQQYKPGDKLPSVRDLAASAAVNPNTMQKAMSELEREGLIYSQRTNGKFITEDIKMINDLAETLAKEEVEKFLQRMEKIGINKDKLIFLINRIAEEGKQ